MDKFLFILFHFIFYLIKFFLFFYLQIFKKEYNLIKKINRFLTQEKTYFLDYIEIKKKIIDKFYLK